MLKEAGIPCIAIEGNHDRRFLKDGMSWLESLEWEGLLKVIKNYDGNLMGGYVEIGGARIFGLGFSGSMTAAAIPQIVQEIRDINAKSPPERTILMLHAGVQGKMKYGIVGEVTYDDLCQLKGLVDYLALGHYHSAYGIDGWAYNPGSPDTCSVAEAGEPKGFYHVSDGDVKLIKPDIREFFPLRVQADTYKSVESLFADIREQLKKSGDHKEPVVHVIIVGTLSFDRSHLNIGAIEGLVKEETGALHVDVRFDLINDEFSISRLESDMLDRASIEREVFRKLAHSDSILASREDFVATSLSDVKDLAVRGADERTLDTVLRKIYHEVKSMPGVAMVTPPALKPEIVAKPLKKARKKPVKAGQQALDIGGGA
jgi:DNA repair exonuclease SbcCD nuclease subunit